MKRENQQLYLQLEHTVNQITTSRNINNQQTAHHALKELKYGTSWLTSYTTKYLTPLGGE